ncbi:ABC transporter permease [Streptomyces antibioticus]|uniref:ABC transporter permease n=1 Tax=Streptomyces antibioticus TaxID=1890 RepID=UPI00224C8C0F|nr:ABC transporter permease [Streptomyces antibioticus]MCX5169974.1 ABC transporter permease [Streptomyces antibioticus]
MSSATTTPHTAPPPTPAGAARDPRRTGAVLALARFEARELLLQAAVPLVFALYALIVITRLVPTDGMDAYPVLNTVDRRTQTLPLLVALSVFICTNAAALRSRKGGTVQQFGVLPMEPWRRSLAHVLSAVPFAALTALFAVAEYVWEALKPGAIGHGSFGELAVGPLTVLMAGALGVLLARVLPTRLGPVLFSIGAYLAFMLASVIADGGGWSGWLSPVVLSPDTSGAPIPSDLIGRPAGWHALYMAGLCALLTCAVLLLAGGGRTRAVRAATVLALVVTAAGAIGQVPRGTAALDAARKAASEKPEKAQSCTMYGRSRYCSFPEWEVVRSEWAGVVDRLQSAAGGSAARAGLTIRQRVYATDGESGGGALWPSSTPGQVTVGTRWGGNRVPEFAVGAASVLVTGREDMTLDEGCDGRTVVVMWLVLGTERDPLDTFQHVRLDDSVSGSGLVLAPTNGLSMTAHQTEVVRDMLREPRAEMTARVKAHWEELTARRTTTAQVAKVLGVEVPKGVETCEE